MSVLTYKVKHFTELGAEIIKAHKVALFAVKTKSRSSKDVKHIGLKSAIANQILKKYSSNKQIKHVKSVKLTVPGLRIKVNVRGIYIPCLRLEIPFVQKVLKVNQVELDAVYAYISCTVQDVSETVPIDYIGVDRNATGHAAVCSIDKKVLKMGKRSLHIRNKYYLMRKNAQKKGQYKFLKKIRHKESCIIRDICHKMSRKVVDIAVTKGYGIKLEQLKGIRKQKNKKSKTFNHLVSNWSFYQLEQFILYKARLLGVNVSFVDPYMTSQTCSVCGLKGLRKGKVFTCACGHRDHADANAAFNIAKAVVLQNPSTVDRDAVESSSGSAREALS
jgi:putative transposase